MTDASSLTRLAEPLRFRDGRALPCRVFPGPMDGVTDGAFVSVLSRRGYVRSWHTPFLRISTGVPGRNRLRGKLAHFLATGLPVNVQIMGTRVECLAETAVRLHELGAVCVDLNCACPSPTVLSSGSGGMHLGDLAWLREAVTALRDACGDHGFSVKVRMGVESAAEFDGIADVLRTGRPDLVVVHYRTVREMYMPITDGLHRLRHAVDALSGIPVIGSGDLFSVDDCIRMAAETGVAGVAPARGLMRNPRMLLELEAAIAGRRLLDWDKVEFLQELCSESLDAHIRDNGFLLRIAVAMFGKGHPLFRQMTQWHTVAATAAGLALLAAGNGQGEACASTLDKGDTDGRIEG